MILDACRNNPFESNWRSKNRSLDLPVSGGLAKIQAPSGSLTAFSTTAGKTAYKWRRAYWRIYSVNWWNILFEKRENN